MTVQVFTGSDIGWAPYPSDLTFMTFPGGEPHVKGSKLREAIIDARVDSFKDIGDILVANDFLRRNGAVRVDLFIPYFPGARQDRGAPLTVKVYADLINAQGFDTVTILDPHSDVAPALIDRVNVIPITDVFPASMWHPDQWVLVCPDQGAGKRVEQVATDYHYQVVYARKHRDFATGKLTGFSCDRIPTGMKALIVDDICDGGGTFNGLAYEIWQQDIADLDLWVSHGIFSQGLAELHKSFGRIVTTDSFPNNQVASLRLHVRSLDSIRGRLGQ